MANKDFNLSVLENVSTFASPFKDSSDYNTIFNLIKEEIDINTEDETESHRAQKSLAYSITKRKESESCDSESIFKSPYRAKYSLRLKSPGSLLKKCSTRESRRNKTSNECHFRRTRSLGALKPGRSYLSYYRKNCSSVSHSSDTWSLSDSGNSSVTEKAKRNVNNGKRIENKAENRTLIIEEDNNLLETAKRILENGEQTETDAENKTLIIAEDNSALEAAKRIIECGGWTGLEMAIRIIENGEQAESQSEDTTLNIAEITGATPIDKNPRESNKGESVFLTSNDPSSYQQTSNNDFVESSQSTASSELRRKLLNRRTAVENKPKNVTDIMERHKEIGSAESKDEGEHSPLNLSLESKSQFNSATRETSLTPSKPRKRKASVISPIMMSTPKKQKFNSTNEMCLKSPRIIRSKETVESPVMSLTQELENCINNSDYEGMTEEIETDMFERTSFTFETIELLNQYEKANQQANNKILSKIFSSSGVKITEAFADGWDDVTVKERPPIEDPLYIDEIAPNIVPPTLKNNNNEKPPREHERKSIIAENTEKPKRRSARTSLVEDSVVNEKKSDERERRSRSITQVEDSESKENIVPSTSKREENMRKVTNGNTRNSIKMEIQEEDDIRRHSVRLKTQKAAKIGVSDLDDDEDLAVEAAKLSKKVEAAEKKAALSEKTLEKLDDLVIRLRHEVLPQHDIEKRAGSKSLSYVQQKEFVKLAPLNKDYYSPSEDEIIRVNWEAFCQDHDWNPKDCKPFLNLKHGDKLIMSCLEERRKFVQFLANDLPNRPLCSVYSRFKILYGKNISAGSRYTSEDDMKILAYMLHKPAENRDKKCSELAKVLGRSRGSISRRYKKLAKKYCPVNEKKVLTKVEWDLPLIEEFITALLDVTLSENLLDLKDAFIPKVAWLQMEKKMDIDNELMKRFWEQQLHMQLFTAEPVYLNEIKIRLIEHMYKQKLWHPAEIKWQHIVKYFDGMTKSFLRNVFNHLTMTTSTKLRSRNLKVILKWLYTKKIDKLRMESKDKYLTRLSYEDKKVKLLQDTERVKSCAEYSESD